MAVFGNRGYYAVSLFIIIVAIAFFVFGFEKKKPTTREIVSLAVMISLAVAGRTVFFMTPQFKPMAAIIIITAVAFGKETGFLCGALSLFLSNIFFGQGPWTPWQMFAFGIVGFLSGLLFHKKYENKKICSRDIIILGIFGGLVVLVVYGTIMDTATVLMYTASPTKEAILAAWSAGFIFNLIHGVSTTIFIFVLGKIMLRKITRLKVKFGMFRQS